MNINIKVNKDFERALQGVVAKYGEDFELLNGFHESQLNYSDFIDGFVDKNVADVTIDANANAHHKDICSLLGEKGKSEDKLFAFNKIFMELKKKYGLRTAKEWLDAEYSGSFYLHDAPSATYKPYCYAYDLTRLANEGLFFLEDYNNEKPHHLTTFLDDVIEFVSFMSNRSSGACGLPNVLLWTFYFWKKDCEQGYYLKNEDYYIRQCFQKFIFRLNQPFLRVDQSAFVNVSIFDRNYFEGLFGGVIFPDGTYAIDYVDEFIEHEKVFMEVVSEIRTQNMFTFPVLTYSLLKRNDMTEEEKQEMLKTKDWNVFVDNDFAKWCSDHNIKWNDSNFFMSDNVGTLSNCPMSGDTKILFWSDYYNKFILSPISEVYFNRNKRNKNKIKVLSNGKIINCKINKFNENANYLITLTNGAKLQTTENHLNKVYGKNYIRTKDLTIDDYLPYSTKQYISNDYLTFEEGKIIGMFLGDGSYKDNHEIVFSLNNETDKDDIKFIEEYCQKHFGAKINYFDCLSQLSNKRKCVNVSVNSDYLKGLITQFVKGNGALNKELDLSVLNCSVEFRKGIIEGIYTTDGNKSSENCNRIYTSSENLKDTLVVLFSSLGLVTKIYEDNREKRLGTNTNYSIRWFTPNGKTKMKNSYILEDDYMWIKIKSIEKIETNKKASFCLEVLDDVEPVFMLGNGIITHNCRLLSDTSKLDPFINSIGGTALSIGSVKVNTINLMRIAYESNFNKKKYLEILSKRVSLCCKTLDIVRHIIKRNIEKGLLPNYCDGGIEIDKQYCTVGILGMYEVIEAFDLIEKDEFGNVYYTDDGIEFASEIFKTINEIKDNFTNEYKFNVESVPAERCAVIICQKDNLLYEKDEKFIYSNQWIPLSEKCTIQEKLRTSSILDNKCSGGAIAHINIESNFPNENMAWDMLNQIALQNVIYFAFNTRINECKNHHGFVGTDICPICGEGVFDTYQRIVGFLEPVRSYSKDRKREFFTRKWYVLD